MFCRKRCRSVGLGTKLTATCCNRALKIGPGDVLYSVLCHPRHARSRKEQYPSCQREATLTVVPDLIKLRLPMHPHHPPPVKQTNASSLLPRTCRKTSSWVVDGPNALSRVKDRQEDAPPPPPPCRPEVFTPTSPSPRASSAMGTPEAFSSAVGGRIRQITCSNKTPKDGWGFSTSVSGPVLRKARSRVDCCTRIKLFRHTLISDRVMKRK